jgi:pyridoxal phosphate enzyme (YggS family)
MSSVSSEDLAANLSDVQRRINGRATLVAVSKTKPAEAVRALYALGQRDFGENYVQELCDKATALAESCPEIRWHFIGHLQSNKVKQLVRDTPRLVGVQTVDSVKLARKLDAACVEPLEVFVQVNTSGEASKSGVSAEDEAALGELLDCVRNECGNLRLGGLMTIGERGDTAADFELLRAVRARVRREGETLGLSMGMSADFETAIEMGSTVVRVGSSLFGAREVKQK